MPTTLDRRELDVSVRSGDISHDLARLCADELVAAIDIETTGLDWSADQIASVQVASGGRVEVVRIQQGSASSPSLLGQLLSAPDVMKVFHHAMFDLRFMRAQWGVHARHIACTKIASKLSDPEGEVGHSLSDVVAHHLGIQLDKSERMSDWFAEDLTPSQVAYAAADVVHLAPLLFSLLNSLRRDGLEQLALDCFNHIPTRVELEVRRLPDVYTY